MVSSSSLAKAWFVLSIGVLGIAYGIASNQFGWFPNSLAEQAWRQAREVYSWTQRRDSDLITSRVYERSGARTVDQDRVQPGLTFITSFWKRSDELGPGLKLIDQEGDVLHEWPVNRKTIFPDSLEMRASPEKDIHGAHLFPNGDVLFNIEYSGTARVNSCGDVKWVLPAGGHHSIARSEDGHFWIPGASHNRRTRTDLYPDGFPGLERPVWLDTILRVTEDGVAVDTINVLDIIYKNDLERYISKPFQPGDTKLPTSDVTHLNDVEPLSSSMADEYPLFDAGDLVVSLRKLDLVFVFDPNTLNVKWHSSEPFIAQHDPDFIGGGWIGVFDNNMDFTERGTMLGGSRIVKIQPHTDSMRVPFPASSSTHIHTRTKGKWQQLQNGNMLLNEVNAGRVVEVSPDGDTVWEWIEKPFSETNTGQVTKAIRVTLTPEEVASWPCSSVDSVDTSSKNQQKTP